MKNYILHAQSCDYQTRPYTAQEQLTTELLRRVGRSVSAKLFCALFAALPVIQDLFSAFLSSLGLHDLVLESRP